MVTGTELYKYIRIYTYILQMRGLGTCAWTERDRLSFVFPAVRKVTYSTKRNIFDTNYFYAQIPTKNH